MRQYHSYTKALSRIRGGTPMRRLHWSDPTQYLYVRPGSRKLYIRNSTTVVPYKLTKSDELSNDWIIYKEPQDESKEET